jgi:hypothetical protein
MSEGIAFIQQHGGPEKKPKLESGTETQGKYRDYFSDYLAFISRIKVCPVFRITKHSVSILIITCSCIKQIFRRMKVQSHSLRMYTRRSMKESLKKMEFLLSKLVPLWVYD